MLCDGIRRSCSSPRSACHQLWYLHVCADAGILVVAYSDDASGVAIDQSDGAGQFESVTLRPHAKLAAGSDESIARRLHDAAAKKCFIARSVAFKVNHYPTFEISVVQVDRSLPPGGTDVCSWHNASVCDVRCQVRYRGMNGPDASEAKST